MSDRRRLNLSLSMKATHQREAWKILRGIPPGQRTDAVCRMVCRAQEQERLLEAVRKVFREELGGAGTSPYKRKISTAAGQGCGRGHPRLFAYAPGGGRYDLIRYFDMFAGIGGFRAGLARAGGFQCVGHCEIDKYADARGTLFFELARMVKAKRPRYLLAENVPGLLSHDHGKTFAVILSTLDDLGYHVEWAVLNSKHFGVPQSRKRVFLICYLDPRCAGEPRRTETARCLTARYGQTTLSTHRAERSGVLLIREPTKQGYKKAAVGDSVDLNYPGSKTRGGRVSRMAHDAVIVQGIVERGGRIRRLMPRECLRLQGFEEEQINKILAINSDAQAYKQAGNSVTINVVEAIGRRIRAVDEELRKEVAA